MLQIQCFHLIQLAPIFANFGGGGERLPPYPQGVDGPALIPVTHLPRFVLDIAVKKSDVTTSCKINL